MNANLKKNFSPGIWGKQCWHIIHLIALSYPNSPNQVDKYKYKQFFWYLGEILPCEACSQNYKRHWMKYPISYYLMNSDTLLQWTILIRNEVQKELQKKFPDKYYPLYDSKKVQFYYESMKSNFDEYSTTKLINFNSTMTKIQVILGIILFFIFVHFILLRG